ncbi:MAG: hypothetical protein ABS76_27485 [Pelagibacterium sp. SCN 64-44]|nr:MAG: hypothetical protein ABS76_27485 [Pelagibacterium sp. SCN 64-44]
MTSPDTRLTRQAWKRVYAITALVVSISALLSAVLTNVLMSALSSGVNLQGLIVAVLLPTAVGGPTIFFLILKHEQLQHSNRQLELMATTDWLTGCLNRGAFTRQVTDLLATRQKTDKGVLLVVDADEFKRVNDRFGHQSGDEALQRIAAAIRHAASSRDLVGRLGGEEFGVFLNHVDADKADRAAERIRRAVADIVFAPEGEPYPLSVSIGGAGCAGHDSFSAVYRQADQQLYEAKHAGRDCVVMGEAA